MSNSEGLCTISSDSNNLDISNVCDERTSQAFLDNIAPVLNTLAGSSSVSFELSDEGSSFNHLEGVIRINYDPEKPVAHNTFICTHEVGHFLDLKNSPKDYFNMFNHVEEESKRFTSEIERNPQNQKLDNKQLQSVIMKELFTLYNVIEDISVNRKAALKVPQFDKDGSKGEVISEVYETMLFPEKDLSKEPKHRQLAYALLLGHMTGKQYKYSEEVVSILNSTTDSFGTKLFEEVSLLTNPATYTGQNIGERIKRVKDQIEPVFKKLLLEEIKDLMNNPEEGGKGEGEGEGEGEESINNWGKIRGGLGRDLTKEDIKKFIEYNKQEAEKQKNENKTTEERAREALDKRDTNICDEYDVNPKYASEYRDIEKRILPYKDSLAGVFEEFMKSIEQRVQKSYIEYCRSGKLNIDSFVKKYGNFSTFYSGEGLIPWDSLDVYDRKDFISRISLSPSNVNFRLVLDTSGSMEGERIESLKEILVLFLESLNTFESRMNLKFRLKEPFQVNTEIRRFASDSEIIKPFQNRIDYRREQAERFACLKKIVPSGATNDIIPLSQVNDSISSLYQKELKSGKKTEILILITDGGSDMEEASKSVVAELIEKGVQVKGLQIGNPQDHEVARFNNIYDENGKAIESLDDLAPSLINLFKDFIERIETKVDSYDVEEG